MSKKNESTIANNEKYNLSIDKVKFTESGVMCNRDKKTKKINLLSQIHILGYKETPDHILSVVCLEYGIFAEGKTRKEAVNMLLFLVNDFLSRNTKEFIEDMLSMQTPITEFFWSLYRLYELKNLPKRILVPVNKTQKNISTSTPNIESLQKELEEAQNQIKQLTEASKINEQIIKSLMQKNEQLRNSSSSDFTMYFSEESKLQNRYKTA